MHKPDDGVKLPTSYTVVMHHKIELPDNQVQVFHDTAVSSAWIVAIAIVLSALFRRSNA